MKKIFRSIINITKDNHPTIELDDLSRNYRAFKASSIQPEDPSYIKLFTMLEAHFRDYKEMPSINLLVTKAQKDGDESVLATLKDIATETPFIKSDYKEILKEIFEEQSKDLLQKVLLLTNQAATSGIKVGKKEIKGISSAVEYFIGESRKFRMTNLSVKTESNIKTGEDSKEVIQSYKDRKADPLKSLGMYTFLDRIDDTYRGLKPGELMLVAAYVKQGKTILTTNLAYNGVMQGLNGLFVSIEMNFEEMRNMFYVLHTCNPDWYEHPKYKNLIGKVTFDKVIYGELDALEQEFFEASSADFPTRKDFGELFMHQPTESLTPSKLELLAYDYNSRLQEQGRTLDFIVVDYVGLMVPDKNDRYGEWNTDLNNIIKKMKILANNFDNGRKLRVITPFQINRTGHKEAEKNDGVFKLSALSNANEAERSSDLIISTFMSEEMKKAGIIKIGCMATRRGADFTPFEARIDFGTRQVREYIQKKKSDDPSKNGVEDIPMDVQ
jgi:hypothetical protein